MRLVAHITS